MLSSRQSGRIRFVKSRRPGWRVHRPAEGIQILPPLSTLPGPPTQQTMAITLAIDALLDGGAIRAEHVAALCTDVFLTARRHPASRAVGPTRLRVVLGLTRAGPFAAAVRASLLLARRLASTSIVSVAGLARQAISARPIASTAVGTTQPHGTVGGAADASQIALVGVAVVVPAGSATYATEKTLPNRRTAQGPHRPGQRTCRRSNRCSWSRRCGSAGRRWDRDGLLTIDAPHFPAYHAPG